MTQALTKQVTFDEFIDWLPENSEVRYELHDGIVIEMPQADWKAFKCDWFSDRRIAPNHHPHG
jgi:Uma2 family endonuclease